jgi:hypothetical protein
MIWWLIGFVVVAYVGVGLVLTCGLGLAAKRGDEQLATYHRLKRRDRAVAERYLAYLIEQHRNVN